MASVFTNKPHSKSSMDPGVLANEAAKQLSGVASSGDNDELAQQLNSTAVTATNDERACAWDVVIYSGFLTWAETIALGSVNHDFENVLRTILKRSKNHYTNTGELLYTEQLPTLGKLSEEESLDEKESLEYSAVLVAKLRDPALRRRSLILFPTSDQESQELRDQRQQVISSYRAIHYEDHETDIRKVSKKYPHLDFRAQHDDSTFVAINLSGVEVFVHSIDRNGNMTSTEIDCILPYAKKALKANDGGTRYRFELPHHVYSGYSKIFHSFALCFEELGQPFAIYQLRRGYMEWPTNEMGVHTRRHVHAISILPGGRIRELNCDAYIEYCPGGNLRLTEEFRVDLSSRDNAVAAEFAKNFYGLNLPSIYDPFWAQGHRKHVNHIKSMRKRIPPEALSRIITKSTWHPSLIAHMGEAFYEVLICRNTPDVDIDNDDGDGDDDLRLGRLGYYNTLDNVRKDERILTGGCLGLGFTFNIFDNEWRITETH